MDPTKSISHTKIINNFTMEFGDILTFLGKLLVTCLALALRNVITAVEYGFVQYPQISRVVFIMVAIYLAYKIARRMIRFWIALIISTIKTILIMVVLVLCFAIYLRGFHRFFSRDIYYLGDWLRTVQQETGDFDLKKYAFNYATKLTAEDDYVYLKEGAKKWLEDNGVEIDESYMGQSFNDIKNHAEEYVQEGLGYAQDFLNNNGVRLGDLNGGNLGNFMNNFR